MKVFVVITVVGLIVVTVPAATVTVFVSSIVVVTFSTSCTLILNFE